MKSKLCKQADLQSLNTVSIRVMFVIWFEWVHLCTLFPFLCALLR